MRRFAGIAVLALTLGVVGAPAQAEAEGFFSPWAGVNFGNDQAEGDFTFGADAAYMGAGIAGVEFDFGFAPNFFGEAVDNHVMTGMVNLILGAPIGGTGGPGVRPYFVAGIGLIRTSVEIADGDNLANNDAGFNVGGGLIGFFSDHVGLKGDVRFFRNFDEIDLSELDEAGGDFDFWRASIGLVFR